MTHPEGDSIMKHAQIGLAALAAMVVAGCGGGGGNSGGSGSFDVTLPDEVRSALVEFEGETYKVEKGETHEVDVEGGQIVISGCPDGCEVTVSRENGQIVVMASVDDVEAKFEPTQTRTSPPTQQQPPPITRPTQPTDTVTRDQNERDKNTARQEGRDTGFQQGQNQAELEQRAPKWISTLANTLPEEDGVTIEHMRGGRPTIGQTLTLLPGKSAPSISDSAFTGYGFSRGDKEAGTGEETLYLYTNIGSPNARPFWKVHGNNADTAIDMSRSDPNFDNVAFTSIATGSRAIPLKSDDTSPDTSGAQEGVYDKLTIDGQLGGTDGTFTCPDCGGTVGGNDDGDGKIEGHVTFSSGKPKFGDPAKWEFKVDTDKLTSNHERPQDETYLYFGFWESEPEEADGTPVFRWIHGGGHNGTGGTNALGSIADLTGTADYSGSAIGKYAIDKTKSGGTAKLGTFTATVALSASFDDRDMLSGRISSFKDDQGGSLSGALVLKGNDSNSASINGVEVSATTGVTGKIDGVNVTGGWVATFRGVPNQAAPDGETCTNGCAADVAGVTGWFHADDGDQAGGDNADVAAIAGAFAAD